MNIIDVYNKCATSTGVNSGKNYNCSPTIEEFNGMIVCPVGFEIPMNKCEKFADVLGYLQDATMNRHANIRVVPIIPLVGTTDNTAEPAKGTHGNGGVASYREKPSEFTFEIDRNDINYIKELMKFNNKYVSVYLVAGDLIVGTKTSTGFSAEPATIYKKKMKFANDKNGNDIMLNFIDSDFLGKRQNVIEIPEDYNLSIDLNGMTELTLTGTAGSGKIDVMVTKTANGENFGNEYSTELAVSSAWVAVKADGTVTSPSAVTYNQATGKFSLSLTQGTYSTVRLADPADLVEIGVGSKSKGAYNSTILANMVVTS